MRTNFGRRRAATATTTAILLLGLGGCEGQEEPAGEIEQAAVGLGEDGTDDDMAEALRQLEEGMPQASAEGEMDWAEATEGRIESVHYPVYPEARLVSFDPSEVPFIVMRAPDPVKDVATYYRERLDEAEWNGEAGEGMHRGTHVFWKGPEDMAWMERVGPGTPHVSLGPALGQPGTRVEMLVERP